MRFHELAVGMSAEYARTATAVDVVPFAGIARDFDPVPADAEAAARIDVAELPPER